MISENDLVEGTFWKPRDFDTKFKLTERRQESKWVSLTRIESSDMFKGYEQIREGLGKTPSGIAFPILEKIGFALDELPFPWQYIEKESIRIPFSAFYNGDFIRVG